MSGVTIVAIPSKDDYVWKLSSEKVPHLTLLHLGEVEDLDHIDEYLEHVVETSMCRFGLSVDRRDTLGPKDADVLLFSKYNVKMLEEVRAYLLKDRVIAEAYHNTEQFPTYIPHLTLGYPETPAHEDTREYGSIHWVNFDTIALWHDDYDGTEYDLEDNSGLDLEMSDNVENFLSHYGVKGMHWGVRRSSTPAVRKRTKPSGDHATVAKLTKHKPKTLTNEELAKVNKRKELERKYSDLNPSKLKKGEGALKTIVATVGTVSSVIALAGSPAGKAAIQAGKRFLTS
jgi:2'-5' RNA ligase